MIYKYDTEQQGNSGEKKTKKQSHILITCILVISVILPHLYL